MLLSKTCRINKHKSSFTSENMSLVLTQQSGKKKKTQREEIGEVAWDAHVNTTVQTAWKTHLLVPTKTPLPRPSLSENWVSAGEECSLLRGKWNKLQNKVINWK